MIVCHCQEIRDTEIHAAIEWMRAADPETTITPGKIYHALGKRADCGDCMPLFLDTMRRSDKLAAATVTEPRSAPSQAIPLLRISKGQPHERRPQGHRLSQRGPSV